MIRKNRESQIFYAGVEPLETDIALPSTTGGSKRTTRVWKRVCSRTRRGKDTSWTLATTDRNLQAPFLGWALKRCLTQTRTCEDELQQKTRRKNQGLCLILLSPHDVLFLFVQLTWSSQFLYSLSFFRRQLKKLL